MSAVVNGALPPPAFLVRVRSCNTHRAGTRFDLVKSPVVVGRVEGAGIVLEHGTVSRRHGCFEPRDGAWWIADLASTSGIFVNEEAIGYQGARRLAERDIVRFGQMEMRISRDPEALHAL